MSEIFEPCECCVYIALRTYRRARESNPVIELNYEAFRPFYFIQNIFTDYYLFISEYDICKKRRILVLSSLQSLQSDRNTVILQVQITRALLHQSLSSDRGTVILQVQITRALLHQRLQLI